MSDFDFKTARDESRLDGIIEITRQHEEKLKRFDKLSDQVAEIHVALIGTYDKPGLIREVKDHSKFIEEHCMQDKENKKERIDWVKWGFRGSVAAGGAWVIAKVKGIIP